MPTYEYRCTSCKHEFEHFQSMKDKTLKKCPSCGKNALERLIGTGAAVIFKGSGFYQTDYRPDSYKKAAEADKAPTPSATPAADTSKAGAAKPDAKPETKADSKTESKPAPVQDTKAKSEPRKDAKKSSAKAKTGS